MKTSLLFRHWGKPSIVSTFLVLSLLVILLAPVFTHAESSFDSKDDKNSLDSDDTKDDSQLTNLKVGAITFYEEWHNMGNVITVDICNTSNITAETKQLDTNIQINGIVQRYGYKDFVLASGKCLSDQDMSLTSYQEPIFAYIKDFNIAPSVKEVLVMVNIDADNVIKESNEKDNLKLEKIKIAPSTEFGNLVVKDISFKPEWSNQKNIIVAEICNESEEVTITSLDELKTSFQYEDADLSKLYFSEEFQLEPKQCTDETNSPFIKTKDLAIVESGVYSIKTNVDIYPWVIPEIYENDNFKVKTISINLVDSEEPILSELPDLYIKNIQFQDEWAGLDNEIVALVCNKGSDIAHSPDNTLTTRFYNNDHESWFRSDGFKFDSGSCKEVAASIATLHINSSGYFDIKIVTDTENDVVEANEENNIFSTSLLIEIEDDSSRIIESIVVVDEIVEEEEIPELPQNLILEVPEKQQEVPIPPAGFEDEVITAYSQFTNPFSDTNINSFEGMAAAELYRRSVIGGYPDGEFKGYRDVNRAELAKFLLLARYEYINDVKNNGQFPDVLEGEWYVKFVVQAALLGIINGYPDGLFRPATTVNTAEFLKMITLTFDLETNLPYTYTDVPKDAWYAAYAGMAQQYKMFPYRGDQQLDPGKKLTRDEVAIAIYQYLLNR